MNSVDTDTSLNSCKISQGEFCVHLRGLFLVDWISVSFSGRNLFNYKEIVIKKEIASLLLEVFVHDIRII